MSNLSLAQRIISLRKSKGFSQEKLAENASINLRTLQRIENGETEPRGYTLQLIAKALAIPVGDFFESIQEEDNGFLQLMNLSSLSFWIVPLGNIFLPLALWYMKKDKVKGVRELGRKIINFQITWSIITFGFLLACIAGAIMYPQVIPFLFPLMILPGIVVLYIVNSILILIASSQINRGAKNIYIPVSLKIIR